MTKGQYYNESDHKLKQLHKHEQEVYAEDVSMSPIDDDNLFDKVDADINDENDDYLWGS